MHRRLLLASVLVALLVGLGTSPVAMPASVAAEEATGSVHAPWVGYRAELGDVTARRTVRWEVQDGYWEGEPPDVAADKSFDVQIVRGGMRRKARPAWAGFRTATTDQVYVIPIDTGQVVCLRAREHLFGETSPWSHKSCVMRPLDDRLVRATGRVRRVDDSLFADGRATVLSGNGRLYLPRVPERAWYGFLSRWRRPAHEYRTVYPNWRIIGHRRPNGSSGVVEGLLHYATYHRYAGGTAVYWAPRDSRTVHIGGLVVIPFWMR